MLELFDWEDLNTDTILLPKELLVYYLYKYEIDKKQKKESQVKEDLYMINLLKKELHL